MHQEYSVNLKWANEVGKKNKKSTYYQCPIEQQRF